MQIKILKIFKKNNKFSHSKWTTTNPGLHWHIVLYGSAVLVLLSFAFGFYLFIQEDREINLLFLSGSKVSVDAISHDRIQKVLDLFSTREKKSADIINNPAAFPDPSL